MTRDFLIAGGAWRVQVLNAGPYLIRITNPHSKALLGQLHSFHVGDERTQGIGDMILNALQVAARWRNDGNVNDLAITGYGELLDALQRDNPDAYRDWIAPLKRDPSTKGEA